MRWGVYSHFFPFDMTALPWCEPLQRFFFFFASLGGEGVKEGRRRRDERSKNESGGKNEGRKEEGLEKKMIYFLLQVTQSTSSKVLYHYSVFSH